MKEKTWRRGVIEKMEGHNVSGSGVAKPSAQAVSVSDVYRDANHGLGLMFQAIARFFGGDKAANRIKVGSGSGGSRRGRTKKSEKKGWF